MNILFVNLISSRVLHHIMVICDSTIYTVVLFFIVYVLVVM